MNKIIQSGFSLIELLVGIMIGMLILLAAVSSASLFEINRQNSIGGNGALENGIAAIFNIQKEVKMAGFGSGFPNPNCNAAITPVSISTPADSTSNSIAVEYFSMNLDDPTEACIKKTNTFSISDNNLQLSDGTNTFDIAENIVQMKAQYGITNGVSNAIIKWVNPANLGADKPKAVRVVVVARSPILSKKIKNANGNMVCDTTSQAPLSGFVPLNNQGQEDWSNVPDDSVNTVSIDLTGITDWKCYSYKTINLTIPMKNILMTSN